MLFLFRGVKLDLIKERVLGLEVQEMSGLGSRWTKGKSPGNEVGRWKVLSKSHFQEDLFNYYKYLNLYPSTLKNHITSYKIQNVIFVS